MSLCDTNMDFKTLYSLEYTPKKGSIVPFNPPNDSNPLSSPWQQHLVPDESLRQMLPEGETYEDPHCVLHRAKIKEKPDLIFLRQLYRRSGQTVYQKDFCQDGDFESKTTRKAKIVPLPPLWVTPLTTQRCSYRDPQSVMGSGLIQPPPKALHCDNIVPNAKEREILKIQTGDSDYMAGIGSLGDFILREKLHGEVKPLGISVWDIKRQMALLDQAN